MNVDMIATMNNAATGAYKLGAQTPKKEQATEESTEKKTSVSDEAAVYEKSSDASAAKSSNSSGVSIAKRNNKVDDDRSALIAQLKADQETRQNQLMDIVKKTMAGQGLTLAKADDMWSFLAGGNFTVDAATKAQAQEDISEDGYWGVKKTSERILDFAKALAGDDPSKADKMLDAFKKGFEEATGVWGKELPDISKQTYDAVLKGFEDWKNSANTVSQTTGTDAQATAQAAQAQQATEVQ